MKASQLTAAINIPWSEIRHELSELYQQILSTTDIRDSASSRRSRGRSASQRRGIFGNVWHTVHTARCESVNRYTNFRSGLASMIMRYVAPLNTAEDYVYGCIDAVMIASVLSATALVLRNASRRYATVEDLPLRLVHRERTLHGVVVAVRDGDNLRVRHTPFMERFLAPVLRQFRKFRKPGRIASKKSANLSMSTLNVRLAGVDAPECAHGIRPGQPYGPAARKWLQRYATGYQVQLRLHAVDQYKRVIATVHRKSKIPVLGLLNIGGRNIGLELVRAGYATVYKGAGAQYGGDRLLTQYVGAEQMAKNCRKGMWRDGVDNVMSPMTFKQLLRGAANNTNTTATKGSQQEKDSSQFQLGRLLRLAFDAYIWLRRLR